MVAGEVNQNLKRHLKRFLEACHKNTAMEFRSHWNKNFQEIASHLWDLDLLSLVLTPSSVPAQYVRFGVVWRDAGGRRSAAATGRDRAPVPGTERNHPWKDAGCRVRASCTGGEARAATAPRRPGAGVRKHETGTQSAQTGTRTPVFTIRYEDMHRHEKVPLLMNWFITSMLSWAGKNCE